VHVQLGEAAEELHGPVLGEVVVEHERRNDRVIHFGAKTDNVARRCFVIEDDSGHTHLHLHVAIAVPCLSGNSHRHDCQQSSYAKPQ